MRITRDGLLIEEHEDIPQNLIRQDRKRARSLLITDLVANGVSRSEAKRLAAESVRGI